MVAGRAVKLESVDLYYYVSWKDATVKLESSP